MVKTRVRARVRARVKVKVSVRVRVRDGPLHSGSTMKSKSDPAACSSLGLTPAGGEINQGWNCIDALGPG